ncbi:MAG: DMT family transporter [Wenzhouxiangellaceae bacterium]
MGLGEIFSLCCAMTWALAVVMFRALGQSLPAYELNLFKNTVGLALLLPTAMLISGPTLPDYTAMEWLIVVLSGYIGIAVADTWYLRALQLLGAARLGVVATMYSPFVILLSAIFLDERLGVWQYPGFILVLAGIMLVTWRHAREQLDRQVLLKGVGIGVSAMMLMAVGVVMVKEVLEVHEFFWTITLRLAGGLAGMVLVTTWRRRWTVTMNAYRTPQHWLGLFAASVLGTYVSMILWLAGYRYTLASIAAVLNETAALFIVLFAWLILKETLNPRKITGLVVAFLGVLILLNG